MNMLRMPLSSTSQFMSEARRSVSPLSRSSPYTAEEST